MFGVEKKWEILAYLYAETILNKKKVSGSDIARYYNMVALPVYNILTKMEKEGYIKREKPVGKIKYITINKRALPLAKKCYEFIQEVYNFDKNL